MGFICRSDTLLHGVILRIFSIVLAWAIQPPFRKMSKGGELWKSGRFMEISSLFDNWVRLGVLLRTYIVMMLL